VLAAGQPIAGLSGHRDVVTGLALCFPDDHLELKRLALAIRRTWIISTSFGPGASTIREPDLIRRSTRSGNPNLPMLRY
jgi:hypothetical protein